MGILAKRAGRKKSPKSLRQRGMTLIETALVLAIMALVVASLSVMMADNADQARARAVADKVTEVHEASKGYIKANYAALLSATAGGPVVIPSGRPNAGAAVPSGPGGLPSLQGGGFLNSGYVDTNGYGQRHSLVVRRIAGNPNALEAIVTTHGGREIPDRQLGRIANFIGASGGYVPETPINAADANSIVGSYGGWRSPAAGWGAVAPAQGTVQATLAFEDGRLLTDYLYRADIGIPEANRMATAIDMNGNDLNRVDTIRGDGGELDIEGNTNVTGNVIATIDVWARRDLRADRDVAATRNVSAGNNVAASNDVSAGRDVTAGRDVSATRNVSAGNDITAGRDLAVGRNARVNGNLDVAGNARLKDINCSTSGGSVTAPCYLDASYVVYGTERGLGKAAGVTLGDLLPREVAQYSYRVTPTANVVPKPTCRGGYNNARIMIYRQVDSTRGYPVIALGEQHVTVGAGTVLGRVWQVVGPSSSYTDSMDGIYATNNGASWTVGWTGNPAVPGTTRQAIAQTYCFYG